MACRRGCALTAELARTDRQRADHRDPLHPSHLICVVEVSGTVTQVRERLDRVDQLIQTAARGTEQRLSVSLITYGPHPVHRDHPRRPRC